MTPTQTMQDVWENLEITIPLDQVCSTLLRNLQSFDMPLFRLVQQFYINRSNENHCSANKHAKRRVQRGFIKSKHSVWRQMFNKRQHSKSWICSRVWKTFLKIPNGGEKWWSTMGRNILLKNYHQNKSKWNNIPKLIQPKNSQRKHLRDKWKDMIANTYPARMSSDQNPCTWHSMKYWLVNRDPYPYHGLLENSYIIFELV